CDCGYGVGNRYYADHGCLAAQGRSTAASGRARAGSRAGVGYDVSRGVWDCGELSYGVSRAVPADFACNGGRGVRVCGELSGRDCDLECGARVWTALVPGGADHSCATAVVAGWVVEGAAGGVRRGVTLKMP